jgi:predicted CoA-binding protein
MPFDFEDPDTTIAVVGASDDADKYGSRIYRNLKSKGYRVIGINPARDTIDGDPAYPSLSAMPEPPTIVDIVVPPPVTLRVLEECTRLGLRNVWVQPGAEDAAVLDYLASSDLDYRAGGPCIMVETTPVA